MAATGHHQIAVLTRLPKTFKIADRLVGIEQGVVDALDKKRIDPGYSLAVATLTGAINTPTMFRQLCLQFLGHTSLPALVKQLIDPRGYPSLTQATRIQVGQPEAFSNTTGCKAVSQIMPGHRRYDGINPRVHQSPGQLEAAGITQPKATHPWVTILLLAKMMSIVGIHPIRPSFTMAWARTVAVVVPSPATSLAWEATSFTICAPMFSNLSFSSISLATGTPSLVTVGAPKDLSRTTLRPFGPRVTLTASARTFTPASILLRAESPNLTSLAAIIG